MFRPRLRDGAGTRGGQGTWRCNRGHQRPALSLSCRVRQAPQSDHQAAAQVTAILHAPRSGATRAPLSPSRAADPRATVIPCPRTQATGNLVPSRRGPAQGSQLYACQHAAPAADVGGHAASRRPGSRIRHAAEGPADKPGRCPPRAAGLLLHRAACSGRGRGPRPRPGPPDRGPAVRAPLPCHRASAVPPGKPSPPQAPASPT